MRGRRLSVKLKSLRAASLVILDRCAIFRPATAGFKLTSPRCITCKTMQLTPDFVDHLMQEALVEARTAAVHDEVPVGAVIAYKGSIIARGRNTTEADQTVVSHAELNAINAAARVLNNWRLSECVLCVTLEPCTMCLGAIRLARIPTIILGAGDSKQGAVGSLYDLSQDTRLGAAVRVITGFRTAECGSILQEFFRRSRTTPKS